MDSSSTTTTTTGTDGSPEQAQAAQAAKAKVLAKTKKLTWIKILGIVFICLGILGAALPILNSTLIARYSKINTNAITAQDMERNLQNAKYFPLEQIEEIGYFNFWKQLNKYDDKNIIGEIIIPALKINLPIFNNSSNENLLVGVGVLYPERKFGEGNFTISGHRAQGKGVLLNALMEAEQGQTIYVTNKKDIYVYSVLKTMQKDISAVEMLNEDQVRYYGTEPIITIMTCYFGKASSRWFVIGRLEAVIPYDKQVLENEYKKNRP